MYNVDKTDIIGRIAYVTSALYWWRPSVWLSVIFLPQNQDKSTIMAQNRSPEATE